MKLNNDEKIIKTKFDFDNSSKTTGFVINDKFNSGVKIILTNKRFYIKPALGWLNKIIPFLPKTVLNIELKEIKNYSVGYVRNIIKKIPRITVSYGSNNSFSFCVTEKELTEWENKFQNLSIKKQ